MFGAAFAYRVPGAAERAFQGAPEKMHDETYKKLFAYPRMVEDLLRGFVAGLRVDDIDFSTLHKLSAEYVSDDLLRRHGDAVWRVRLRERWLYLVVLLEFQSRDEPRMALRILTYTGLLYEELVRNGEVASGELLPAVLPVVLYNGARPWKAAREMRELIATVGPDLTRYQPAQRYHVVDERHLAENGLPSDNLMTSVVALEQSGSAQDLARVVEALQAKLGGSDETGLRQAFIDWVRQAAERVAPPGRWVRPVRTLEELKMTLVERAAEWPKQWLQEGIEQGIEQGLTHERALLRRQAALRFGEEAAARAAPALARIADPEGLATAGDWIVRAGDGDELVARLMQLAAERDAH